MSDKTMLNEAVDLLRRVNTALGCKRPPKDGDKRTKAVIVWHDADIFLRGILTNTNKQKPNKPRPLEYVWVRRSISRKWHRCRFWHRYEGIKNISLCHRKLRSMTKGLLLYVTADTPDEKDCCKKCYAKTKEKTDA